jgi:hypothetical protein
MELIKEAKRWQKLAGILKEQGETPEEPTTPEQPETPSAETPDQPSGPITKTEAKQMIKDTKGKFFTVTFTKKDGTTRVMNCRLGVKLYLKGGELAYNPEEKGLIPVWDPAAHKSTGNGYRMISINTITKLKIGNNEYEVR